jgi:hypothetical protein
MKNTLTIIMDTEAEDTILIGKPQNMQPNTPEEMADMVLLDMGTLCEALVVTIRTGHVMEIKDESDSIRDCIHHIQQAFVDSELKVRPGSGFDGENLKLRS